MTFLVVASLAASLAPAVEKKFEAMCDHESHGSSGWSGPLRITYEMAKQDADTHNKRNPGHKASVVNH
jgi:hypothetical protein